MNTSARLSFRLRSFVRRDSRISNAQRDAYAELFPVLGLKKDAGFMQNKQVFGREAPLILEIGFGTGQSLLSIAKAHPDKNFIGVETHKPGVGALLLGMKLQGLSNIRVYAEDVVDVLQHCIPENSLDDVLIFFPDPWPKRRHHARRLIQPLFLKSLVKCLKTNATIHLATDWEDYAKHMMQVLSHEEKLVNLAGRGQFAERSTYRPIITKFEQKAVRAERKTWELQFKQS